MAETDMHYLVQWEDRFLSVIEKKCIKKPSKLHYSEGDLIEAAFGEKLYEAVIQETHPNTKYLQRQAKLPPKYPFGIVKKWQNGPPGGINIQSSNCNTDSSNQRPNKETAGNGSSRETNQSKTNKESSNETSGNGSSNETNQNKTNKKSSNETSGNGSSSETNQSKTNKESSNETSGNESHNQTNLNKTNEESSNETSGNGSSNMTKKSKTNKESSNETSNETTKRKEPSFEDEAKSLRRKVRKLEDRVAALEREFEKPASKSEDEVALCLVSHLSNGDVVGTVRILAKHLFSEEELINSSRTGKKTIKSGDQPRPPLNHEKMITLERLVLLKTNASKSEFIKKLENFQKVLRRRIK